MASAMAMIRALETCGLPPAHDDDADRGSRDGAGHQQPAEPGAARIRKGDRLGGGDAEGRDQAEPEQSAQDAVTRDHPGGRPEVGEEAGEAGPRFARHGAGRDHEGDDHGGDDEGREVQRQPPDGPERDAR